MGHMGRMGLMVVVMMAWRCFGIEFTGAVSVVSNAVPLAVEQNALAQSFGERLASGIGDGVWRLWFRAYSLTRQMREPTEGLNPAWDEWFERWMASTNGGYVSDAEYEDANPLCRFVFGWGGATGDYDRLATVMASGGTSAKDCWEDAKTQRGWVTSAGVTTYAPAYTAARAWRAVRRQGQTMALSSFLTTYGGFVAQPSNHIFTDLFFTNTTTYTDGGVWLGNSYYYRTNSTATNEYWKNQWLYGPHLGAPEPSFGAFNMPYGSVAPQDYGNELGEAMQWYLAEFRGSDAQRTNESRRVRSEAFDFQRFFTSQYYLAPARGETNGVYPEQETSGAVTNGQALFAGVATNGYCYSGFRITGTNAMGYQIQSNGVVILSGELWSGGGTNVHLFEHGLTNLTVVATGTNAGNYRVEVAEVAVMRPELEDAYLCLRQWAGDAHGGNVTTPKRFSDLYFTTGCIADAGGVMEETAVLGDHPLVESMRRMLCKNMRFMKRWADADHVSPMLLGYSVDASNRSVLRFERYYQDGADAVDVWAGMLPTGTNTNGIVAVAAEAGYDNRWLFTVQGYPYAHDGVMEPELWADNYTALVNKGMLFSSELPIAGGGMDAKLRQFVDVYFRQTGAVDGTLLQPEAPSYLTYAAGINQGGGSNFFMANEIYHKPYEVVSVGLDASNKVVVTLDRQLQNFGGTNQPRSDENLITDFLTFQAGGGDAPLRVGDIAAEPDGNEPSGLCGSVIPRFYFTRMPVQVYAGTNTNAVARTWMTAEDMMWLGWVLSAVCEGFVDTQVGNCGTPGVWTLPNLLYKTGGSRWLDLLSANARADRAQGFGAMPNTALYARGFNQLAAAVNALTNAPIDIPGLLEYRIISYTGTSNGYPWTYGPAAWTNYCSLAHWGFATVAGDLNGLAGTAYATNGGGTNSTVWFTDMANISASLNADMNIMSCFNLGEGFDAPDNTAAGPILHVLRSKAEIRRSSMGDFQFSIPVEIRSDVLSNVLMLASGFNGWDYKFEMPSGTNTIPYVGTNVTAQTYDVISTRTPLCMEIPPGVFYNTNMVWDLNAPGLMPSLIWATTLGQFNPLSQGDSVSSVSLNSVGGTVVRCRVREE